MNTSENHKPNPAELTDLLVELNDIFELFEKVCEREKERLGRTGLDGHLNLILGCSREARKKISLANPKKVSEA